MKHVRQMYRSEEEGDIQFVDIQEYNYNRFCQPLHIVVLSPCKDEKAMRADICASIRAGQGMGQAGLYANLKF